MSYFTKFSLKNAASVFLISILLIVGGIYSFNKLKMDLFPDLDVPALVVQVISPGATASDMDEQVNKQVEKQIKSLSSLDTFQTTSSDNASFYIMQFDYGTDMEKKEKELNDILDKATLPEKATTNVMRFTTGSIPIINATLQGKDGHDIQKVVQNELKDELGNVEGVNEVQFFGLTKDVVDITLQKDKALLQGVTMQQIQDAIQSNQAGFPVGTIKENDENIPVRLEKTAEELKNVPIKTQNGTVKLSEVATVTEETKSTEMGRYNGKDVVAISVTKTQDGNTVDVTDKVISVLKKHKNDISYHMVFEQADSIKESVKTLVKEGLFGALFASVTILVFLRSLRATLIAIISIPLSLLITGIILHQMDITLNVMTLGAMAVAVGRVVDDSIVVIENIYRRMRLRKEGETKDGLVVESTKEIIGAITASTITTAVVFLPIGLVGGVAGQFFLPFALTVVIALFASLLVAITLVPILAKYSFKGASNHLKEGMLEKAYGAVIKKALKHKLIVLLISVILLIASFSIVPKLGFTFIPNEKQKMLSASVVLNSSTPIEKTNTLSLQAEKALTKNRNVKDITTLVGGSSTGLGGASENEFSYTLNLTEQADIDKAVKAIKKELEKHVPADAKVTVQEMMSGGMPGSNAITVDLYNNNLEELQQDAKKVADVFKHEKNMKSVQNNFEDKKARYNVLLDNEKMKTYGVDAQTAMGIVASQLQNVSFTYTAANGQERNVQIEYDKKVGSQEDIAKTVIMSEKGPITLGMVASIEKGDTFVTLEKLDGKVYAEISGETTEKNIQAATDTLKKKIKKEVTLHENTKIDTGGGSEDATEAFGQIGMAMFVAVGLVYLTMLITFKKVRLPFVILSSLLFVPIGALGALLLTGEPLSVSVMIGILMLIGIVTTNAIVFVDRVGQNINGQGLTIRDSLIEAGKTRLRPILMTAFATVTALLPLAFSTASGTLISKGLAIVVIGGLTTSTLLTLIVLPVIYELFFFRKVKKELKEVETKA